MENSKIAAQVSENFRQMPLDTTEARNEDVRFWQSVSLSLAIFALSLFASLVMALVLMLAAR
jgi:disulfide bond formation protein DsbB